MLEAVGLTMPKSRTLAGHLAHDHPDKNQFDHDNDHAAFDQDLDKDKVRRLCGSRLFISLNRLCYQLFLIQDLVNVHSAHVNRYHAAPTTLDRLVLVLALYSLFPWAPHVKNRRQDDDEPTGIDQLHGG